MNHLVARAPDHRVARAPDHRVAQAPLPAAPLPTASLTVGPHRVDLYRNIHKGLRALMCENLLAFGRLDPTDAAEVGDAVERLGELVELMRGHLRHENRFLHPAMDADRPGAAQRTVDDHVEHEAALDALDRARRELVRMPRSACAGAAHRLYRDLALFVAENLEHMEFEESHNMAVLQSGHDDASLRAIERALVAEIPPAASVAYLRWTLPALSPSERAEMMAELREGMPPPAYAGIHALVTPLCLPAHRAALDALAPADQSLSTRSTSSCPALG